MSAIFLANDVPVLTAQPGTGLFILEVLSGTEQFQIALTRHQARVMTEIGRLEINRTEPVAEVIPLKRGQP